MASRWTHVLLVLVLVAVSGDNATARGESNRPRQELAASLEQSSPLKALKRIAKPDHDARKLATWNSHGAPAREAFVLENRSRYVTVTTEPAARDAATAARHAGSARGPPHT